MTAFRVGDVVYVDPVLAGFRRGFDPCGVVTAVRVGGVTVEHLDRWSPSGVVRRGYPVEWITSAGLAAGDRRG